MPAMPPSIPAVFIAPRLRAAQGVLGDAGLRFLDFIETNPEGFRRATFSRLDGPHRLRWDPAQTWPTLLDPETVAAFQPAAVELPLLLRRVMARLFAGDGARIRDLFGLDDRLSRLLGHVLTRRDQGGCMARGDFLWTERGLQCMELNMSAVLGGWECAAWAEDHLKVPFFRRFLDEAGLELEVQGTLDAMLGRVFEDSVPLAVPGGEIHAVVLVDPKTFGPLHHPLLEELARLWREIPEAEGWKGSSRLDLCTAAELEDRGGKLYRRGSRVHAVVELHVGLTPPQVLKPWLGGELRLYNGPLTLLLGDKRCLALLSEQASAPEGESRLEDRERELVRRLVPWTRRVVPGAVEIEGETLPCEDLLRLGKDRLVLKHGRGLSGNDVYVGLGTPEETWQEICHGALHSGAWIVQELLSSLPFPYQDDEQGIVPATVVWGLFGFDGSYGGCFTRSVPQGQTRVVNASKGSRDGACFEVCRAFSTA